MTSNEKTDEIVELQPEETKAVVGGQAQTAPEINFRKAQPAVKAELREAAVLRNN